MTDERKDTRSKSEGDTEESLEKELSREAAEGADSIGDVASNRTLSGSSSWETLPDGATEGERDSKEGKKPGK